MKLHFTLLSVAAFLVSTASAEVIVKKTFRPLPFSGSMGLDGIYKIELRDANNRVHRQMVTAEVFNRYAVGDDFIDRLPASEKVRGLQLRRLDEPKRALLARAGQAVRKTSPVRRRAIAAKVVTPSSRPANHAATNDLHIAQTELRLVRAADKRVSQAELRLVQAARKRKSASATKGGKYRAASALTPVAPMQEMRAETEGF